MAKSMGKKGTLCGPNSRQATDVVIIKFLENNILSHFGCPRKIITDNAAAFRSKKLIDFCSHYHIVFGHSTAYYP
jgi:hypothetical protein